MPAVIELTVILSPLYVCYDMIILFLSALGKLPPCCLIET